MFELESGVDQVEACACAGKWTSRSLPNPAKGGALRGEILQVMFRLCIVHSVLRTELASNDSYVVPGLRGLTTADTSSRVEKQEPPKSGFALYTIWLLNLDWSLRPLLPLADGPCHTFQQLNVGRSVVVSDSRLVGGDLKKTPPARHRDTKLGAAGEPYVVALGGL